MAPDRFDLDDLLGGMADSGSPSVRQQSLVKALMAIDYLPTAIEKIRQLDERLAALRGLEAEVHARIVGHPDLRGAAPPPVPPPSIAGAFEVLMAVQTALDKLAQTRAALARRLP